MFKGLGPSCVYYKILEPSGSFLSLFAMYNPAGNTSCEELLSLPWPAINN